MLRYTSGFNPPQPYTPQQRADALSGIRMRSPYAHYGQNQQDVLDAAGSVNAAGLDAAIAKSNADSELERLRGQQTLALAGLQQLSQAQEQQRDLETRRLTTGMGFISPVLRGLFS